MRSYRNLHSATKYSGKDFISQTGSQPSERSGGRDSTHDFRTASGCIERLPRNDDGAIGQFRSYNRHEGAKNRLVLSVFVREIHFLEEFTDYTKTNQIFLEGYICKEPIYRKTPLGREIADMLLAVNRPYGKSDYIPCIAWGRNARYASGFGVGSHVCVWGRVQSREYTKKLSETECEKRVAYEVSVSKLECVEE